MLTMTYADWDFAGMLVAVIGLALLLVGGSLVVLALIYGDTSTLTL